MRITIKFYTTLRERVGSETSLEANDVSEAISKLKSNYGNKIDLLFDEKGKVKNYFILLLNGKVLDKEKLSQYTLNEGDVLHIFPPIAGG